MKRVAIVQSSYIPWKGYFDLIGLVDEFILYDDTQYTRRDWRNRNKIKTPTGPAWLTIPVEVSGKYYQKIRETRIFDMDWQHRHLNMVVQNYRKAKYFKEYKDVLTSLYLNTHEQSLSEVNYRFLRAFCDMLGITTRITWSMDYHLLEGKTERLVDLCRQAQATEYLSGPTARDYIDERLFREAGIALVFMDYSVYPEYEQLYPPFDHHVSIVDLVLNTGPAARNYLKSFGA